MKKETSVGIFKTFLQHPLLKGRDIDDPETIRVVSRLVKDKKFLQKLYVSWYKEILTELPSNIDGIVLEIGTGAGFFKNFCPDLITSDVAHAPDIDVVLDGRFLPIKNTSLRAVVLIDVFHHIPNVKLFFNEMDRCLKPGGVIVMIEPWVTWWSHQIYEKMHHEPFDRDTREWSFPEGGALTSANLALAWICFERDINKFHEDFINFAIKRNRLHTPFRYLMSGGVSLRSLMPGFLFPFFTKFEMLMAPFMNKLAMFATIVLVRNGNSCH